METLAITSKGPVSMAMFRDHLRVYHTADDINIRSALDTAMAAWDAETLRPVRDTQYKQEFEQAPAGWQFNAGPVTEINSVKFFDKDTLVATEIAASDYRVSRKGSWDKLQFLYDYMGNDSQAARWEVVWTVTWPHPPADVLRAIMMLGATFYDERDQLTPLQMRAVTVGWNSITNRYKWGKF